MVTSVNGASLAALLAQENALANRTSTQTPSLTDPNAGQGQDPASVFTGSSDAPNLSAVLSVQDSLNRAASISDVGISAAKTISDLLSLVREKAIAAQNPSGGQDKTALNADYQQLLQTIDQLAKSASFQGVTMLNGASGGDLQFKTGVTGEATVGLTPQDFTVGGPTIGLAGTDLLGSPADLASVLGQVDAAGGALSTQLTQMSAQSDQIQTHLGLVGRLQSALAGQGTTDLNTESAQLQALSVQQVLAGQTQSVANQAPQALLSLFR